MITSLTIEALDDRQQQIKHEQRVIDTIAREEGIDYQERVSLQEWHRQWCFTRDGATHPLDFYGSRKLSRANVHQDDAHELARFKLINIPEYRMLIHRMYEQLLPRFLH